jgi:putative ABC transport system ATP-binding protein
MPLMGASKPQETEVAVTCRSVIRDFGSGQTVTRVLHGIDLEVYVGDITFLVGPSGCGKTTLISIIAGLLNPTAGSIHLFGNDIGTIRGSRMVDFRSKNIGFIFQQFNLLPSLTAAENVAVPLIGQGVPFRRAVAQATATLGELEMGKHARKYPNQLSGGQQQRVAVARSIVHNPRLVICDEPTASLDASTGHAVMEMLRDLASGSDRAIIVVTHDNRIFSFADRIASMVDGRISAVERQSSSNTIQTINTSEASL